MRTCQQIGLWMLIAGSLPAMGCGGTGDESSTQATTEGSSGTDTGSAGAGTGSAGAGTGGNAGGAGSSSTGTGTNCDLVAPVLASPGDGATVPGGPIALQWSGGAGPYEVEIAFDAAFTDPVASVSPITTSASSVTVTGLNGGYFYWRVRSLGGGDCAGSAPTAPAELHVTCTPFKLASGPVLSYYASALAWNAEDHEYGVALSRVEAGKYHLLFARVDRLGKIVFGPTELSGGSLPDPSSGGYQNPSLAYVTSTGLWATAYHREGDDQSYVSLFDDSGTVIATQALDDGSDSEFQSVSYDPGLDRLVISSDHGGSPWNTYVQRFDTALNPVGASVNVSNCTGGENSCNTGLALTLPGLAGVGSSALAVFDVRESLASDTHRLFGQRVDLTTGAVAWPKGGGAGASDGVELAASPGSGLSFLATLDWNPDGQNVGVAYTVQPPVVGAVANVYFATLDPETGTMLSPAALLNTGAPGKAHRTMPKVAWDGEEFLATWMDGRGPAQGAIRMTKLSSSGAVIGGGDVLFPQAGWSNGLSAWTGRSLVGHDRIHAFVSNHRDTQESPNEAWMCIEPAYP